MFNCLRGARKTWEGSHWPAVWVQSEPPANNTLFLFQSSWEQRPQPRTSLGRKISALGDSANVLQTSGFWRSFLKLNHLFSKQMIRFKLLRRENIFLLSLMWVDYDYHKTCIISPVSPLLVPTCTCLDCNFSLVKAKCTGCPRKNARLCLKSARGP